MTVTRELVKILREERLRQGRTMTDISYRLGMARTYIRDLENGKTVEPSLETFARWANVLGFRLDIRVYK